jgi:hypothetical protein
MAASQTKTLRIVDKAAYDKQYFFPFSPSSLPALAPGHLRLQPSMLGLASYNMAYCAMGDILKWYNAYPLLRTAPGDILPSEFRDESRYAVPPGWGYATILESNMEGLEVGQRLYGMLPMCDVVVDLRLAGVEGTKGRHWDEVSEHRVPMMDIYKRYLVVEEDFAEGTTEEERRWRCGAFTVWQCGYLMNRYCFSAWEGE